MNTGLEIEKLLGMVQGLGKRETERNRPRKCMKKTKRTEHKGRIFIRRYTGRP